MRRRNYTPWQGAAGQVETVTLPAGPVTGVVGALALAASFSGAGTVTPPVGATIEVAQLARGAAVFNVAAGASYPTPVGMWRADQGVTLGATLKAAGSSPPVVTISGSLALTTSALKAGGGIQLRFPTTGGARGVAQFDVSYDNGATWALTEQLTAATFALGGNATGITLNFPTGTYSTGHTYKATVETWTSIEGNSRAFTNATAAQQPVYMVTGDGSKPALLFDGSDDRLVNSDAAMFAPFTDGNTFTLWVRHSFTTADRDGFFFSAANSASANGSRRFGQTVTGNGRHRDHYTNDAAASAISIRTTPELDTSVHTAEWSFTSNQSTLQVDGDTANPNAAAFTPGTLTPNRCAIGCNIDSTPDTFHAGLIAQVTVWSQTLDSTQQTTARAALAA